MTDFKNTTLAPERLTEQDLQVRPPLELEWLENPKDDQDPGYDARIRLSYQGHTDIFAVEYKKNWTAAALNASMEQAKRWAKRHPGDLPMVVLPYLNSEMLNTLLKAEVNGLDLVGNGVIYTPDWFLLMDGQPNTFKNTQVIKSPYQGKSALVARTLLSMPVLPNAEALRAEIEKHGGKVSQPVVSRALKAFRDDLIVGSQGEYSIVLLQPEKLLDRLAEQWKGIVERWNSSGNTVLWSGRVAGDVTDILRHLTQQAEASGERLVASGVSASLKHASVASAEAVSLYADQPEQLLKGLSAEPTRRFPNLYFLRPPDEAVFFDSHLIEGALWPSLVQRYLELTVGDVRLQGSAKVIRQEIVQALNEYKKVVLSMKDIA